MNHPDGGEWQYGVRWNYEKSKGIDWWSGTEEQLIAYVARFDGKALAVKRWIGPAEPVSKPSDTPPESMTDR